MRYGLDLGAPRDYLIEHSAERRTIDRPWLHGEADDAAGELIHHNHHPVRLEDQRFTTEQIETSKAVFGVSCRIARHFSLIARSARASRLRAAY